MATHSSPSTTTNRPHAASRGLAALACLAVLGACGRGGDSRAVRVAAASDLALAFAEIGQTFTAQTGIAVEFDFGSTGLLAKQIVEGAPIDVFASADRAHAEKVVAAGRCDGATLAPYGLGRVVLWVRSGAPPANVAALADPAWKRVAIASPDHAPYGKAGKEALTAAGVWAAVGPKLVEGENVRQALQYAQTGNVDVSIVALSLAIGTPEGAYTEVPAELHGPIDQTLVVCGHGAGPKGGQAFADYVASPAGRATMARFGFVLPPTGR